MKREPAQPHERERLDISRRRFTYWRRRWPGVEDEKLAAGVASVDRAIKRRPA